MQMSRLEAWEIAEKVGLGEFIKYLPMQMDTLITEGAITLSGGEAQRLILARALAQKPKILVLDEATSALDNTTQAIVHNYLKQLQATQIIAAHRLSTIVNADRIVVIDKGVIVQSGTFAELMSHPGLFAQMARRQF
jgi:ATP-binding cassette subfamily C protein